MNHKSLNDIEKEILEIVMDNELPIMELSKKVNVVYKNFLVHLKRLEEKNLINRKQLKGRTTIITPNNEEIIKYINYETEKLIKFSWKAYINIEHFQKSIIDINFIELKKVPKLVRINILPDLIKNPDNYIIGLSQKKKKELKSK